MSETKRATVAAAEEILGLYFPMLDHGFVSLVDYMGGDEATEQAARVSYGSESHKAGERTAEQTRGLIRYMLRHRHTSPSEMTELKFHCSMPIFVARQWIRHRTASVNEVSGRYSILPTIFYSPPLDQLRAQSATNKQGREGEIADDVKEEVYARWNAQREVASGNYTWLVGNDFARELARIDLPLSTYTQWYWKIDMHNLLHFLTLRVDSHAQWEIRQYAEIIAGMLKRVAPLSYEAWVDYELCGMRLSRMEATIVRDHAVLMCGPKSSSPNALKFVGSPVMDARELASYGLTEREVDEFLSSLWSQNSLPNHELDLSRARSAAYFVELAQKAALQGT